MSINVYWACLENEWMRAEKPESLEKRFYSNPKINSSIIKCPAFKDSLKNIFCIKSIYDYEFSLKNGVVTSSYYDQNFFDNHVYIRSVEERVFSFNNWYIFFTDQPSLKVTANIHPFLEKNNVTDRSIVFQGTFDIGKWFRNIEMSFYLKPEYDSFKIEGGEVFSYIKFHTDEKINFIQYRHNEKISSLLKDTLSSRSGVLQKRKLTDYYKNFKIKKIVLNEIKKEII